MRLYGTVRQSPHYGEGSSGISPPLRSCPHPLRDIGLHKRITHTIGVSSGSGIFPLLRLKPLNDMNLVQIDEGLMGTVFFQPFQFITLSCRE